MCHTSRYSHFFQESGNAFKPNSGFGYCPFCGSVSVVVTQSKLTNPQFPIEKRDSQAESDLNLTTITQTKMTEIPEYIKGQVAEQ